MISLACDVADVKHPDDHNSLGYVTERSMSEALRKGPAPHDRCFASPHRRKIAR
jgi:hypothetical protein